MDDGLVEGLPGGHESPEHGADLIITGSELLVILSGEISTVQSKIQPEFGLLGFTKRIVEAILEDSLVPPFGKALNDVAAHRPGRTPDLIS